MKDAAYQVGHIHSLSLHFMYMHQRAIGPPDRLLLHSFGCPSLWLDDQVILVAGIVQVDNKSKPNPSATEAALSGECVN